MVKKATCSINLKTARFVKDGSDWPSVKSIILFIIKNYHYEKN